MIELFSEERSAFVSVVIRKAKQSCSKVKCHPCFEAIWPCVWLKVDDCVRQAVKRGDRVMIFIICWSFYLSIHLVAETELHWACQQSHYSTHWSICVHFLLSALWINAMHADLFLRFVFAGAVMSNPQFVCIMKTSWLGGDKLLK